MRLPRPRALIALLVAIALGVVAASARRPAHGPVTVLSGPTMGTRYAVTIGGALDSHARAQTLAAVGRELARVDAVMSNWRADSEVERLNRSWTTSPVSRPFCNWVCPVDTTEQIARYVRVQLLRLAGRHPAPRERRPIMLPMARVTEGAPDPLRRVRNLALTAIGQLCAMLVLGHFYAGFSGASLGAHENLMGDTFVSVAGERP